jgi:zeaxanthin glucosyltransferase
MTHFGLVFPAASGHINPVLPLGVELQRRGHQVTCFCTIDAAPKVAAAGLQQETIGLEQFPAGRAIELSNQLGELQGIAALRFTIDIFRQATAMRLRELPDRLRALGIETLIYDQQLWEGTTIAAHTNLPIVTFTAALITNPEPSIPPFFTDRAYQPGAWNNLQNQLGTKFFRYLTTSIIQLVDRARAEWQLPPIKNPTEYHSSIAQISQQPAVFEYPRPSLPDWCHFVGPMHTSSSRQSVTFPWKKLDGRPLIYASLGTLQNQLMSVFTKIAESCQDTPYQLVISLGRSEAQIPDLPGQPIVVPFAPQLEILEQTSLVITHAGLNTTLECLGRGVPMIAIPLANDQPGVAARIAWSGCGEKISPKKLTTALLRQKIDRVMENDSYRDRASFLQQAIQKAGGVTMAANICEAAARGVPVSSVAHPKTA